MFSVRRRAQFGKGSMPMRNATRQRNESLLKRHTTPM
jgi:hypothetical protein